MRTITVNLYEFDELDDKAKKKARTWYRRADDGDTFWSERVIEDFLQIAKYLGFDIDANNVRWSGFWSQGDGASFTGMWSASSVIPGEAVKYAPEDKRLHDVARHIETLASGHPRLRAELTRFAGNYVHECMIDADAWVSDEDNDDKAVGDGLRREFRDMARDLMQWLYLQLETEYNYMTADARVDENIRINDYTFTADGERYG